MEAVVEWLGTVNFDIPPQSFVVILLKVELSPSKKICVICLIESLLKMMKNGFYFILKDLSVLKIFKFLSRIFGHVGKTA